MGGVQKTTDFLVKATWYLTAALFALCIAAGIQFGNQSMDTGIEMESIASPIQTAPAGAPAGTEVPSMGDVGVPAEPASEPAAAE
jgi:preprotein translocase subunit SecG